MEPSRERGGDGEQTGLVTCHHGVGHWSAGIMRRGSGLTSLFNVITMPPRPRPSSTLHVGVAIIISVQLF